MKKNFYVTTTLPYVNADPHIGFAKEIVQADVLARAHRLRGDDVFFNTGTDEHGLKIFRKAQELGIPAQKYCDEKSAEFDKLKKSLNLSYDNFIRTTDEYHMKAAQEFWKRCERSGDIYKKNYKVKYCVGCELEKTDSELVDGRCPLHPNAELEIIEEENYFFRFSAYQEKLLELYASNPEFVWPKKRLNEVRTFVDGGLEDFSISRVKEKMPWGVPVPGDEDQVMYVWFDALVNYVSALGWPEKTAKFEKFWPGAQVCGKDNLRQQAAMWQAMLFSAKLPASKQIFVNGFITVSGQKMSKSLGNVISPYEMTEKFGVDGARYLLLSGANFGEDFDITWEKMIEKYNADLANGLGNLTSRVIKLAQISNDKFPMTNQVQISNDKFNSLIEKMELSQALEHIWKIIDEDNKFIGENKPWELTKADTEKFGKVMRKLLDDLVKISTLLQPLMPDTAEKILQALKTKKTEALFGRIK
jgi:methionyl-tRNA synthetase